MSNADAIEAINHLFEDELDSALVSEDTFGCLAADEAHCMARRLPNCVASSSAAYFMSLAKNLIRESTIRLDLLSSTKFEKFRVLQFAPITANPEEACSHFQYSRVAAAVAVAMKTQERCDSMTRTNIAKIVDWASQASAAFGGKAVSMKDIRQHEGRMLVGRLDSGPNVGTWLSILKIRFDIVTRHQVSDLLEGVEVTATAFANRSLDICMHRSPKWFACGCFALALATAKLLPVASLGPAHCDPQLMQQVLDAMQPQMPTIRMTEGLKNAHALAPAAFAFATKSSAATIKESSLAVLQNCVIGSNNGIWPRGMTLPHGPIEKDQQCETVVCI